ncbi:MAG: hypothetical protein EBU52_09485, partial [Cytophagia bacterium]|nr:hypothetical protein [Cytophagia bacterium]
MKNLPFKVLSWIINLSLIGYIAGVILILFLHFNNEINSYHFYFGLSNKKTYPLDKSFAPVQVTNPDISNATLTATQIAIRFNTSSLPLRILFWSATVFQILYTVSLLLILRRIINSIKLKSSFSEKIIRDVRLIGILLLLIEPLYWIGDRFKTITMKHYFTDSINNSGEFINKTKDQFGL